MSTNPVRKRRRVDITAAQKKELCKYKETHPKATQAELMTQFSKQYGASIGRSTISVIILSLC